MLEHCFDCRGIYEKLIPKHFKEKFNLFIAGFTY